MNKPTLSAMLLAGLLTGCTMIPSYEMPSLPVLDSWQEQPEPQPVPPVPEAGVKAAREIAWQAFFESPQMRQLIDAALEHNRDLKMAALNVEAVRALYRVERSDLVPGIDVGASGSRQKVTKAQSTSNPLFNTPQEYITSTYTANVASTAFELDLFGKLRSENEAALERYFASQQAHDAAKVALIAQTANTYLQWLADGEILKLTQETLATQEKSFTLISKSYESGVASKLDLAQVRQAVQTAKANQALYSRRVMQDRNALQLLVGTQDITPILGQVELQQVKLRRDLPLGLPSEVLLVRPDIRQAEHELNAANANIGAARAAFFPTISLTGAYGYASRDLGDLFTGAASGAWSFAPKITMPIFQGGRNLANLDYASLVKEASVANYEKTIQTAFREVSDELAARMTLDEELQAQQQLVAATQDAYDLSYARYREGIDSFLNVLDAQRSLFAARQQEIEIQKQRLANLVNLYKALGGGLISDETAIAPEPVTTPEAEPLPVSQSAPETAPEPESEPETPVVLTPEIPAQPAPEHVQESVEEVAAPAPAAPVIPVAPNEPEPLPAIPPAPVPVN